MLGRGGTGGLACKPGVADPACHKCSNRAYFGTATRSLGATALYVKMKRALREKELEEHGC